MKSTLQEPDIFKRNRLTWLAYAMLAYIGFTQAILGPLMPFLRSELNLNYTLGGLLPAAIASGLIFSGLFGGWLTQHVRRQGLFWSGGVGLAGSAILMAFSHSFGLVLLSILIMGICGSMAQIMIQALLSDQHGELRAIALTESNVAASLFGAFTPLVLSGLQFAGLSWRSVSIITTLFLVMLVAFFKKDSIPDSIQTPKETITQQVQVQENKTGLPFSFWLYWCVLFFMVAFEMSLSIWTTDYFASVVGLSRANAVLAFGVFPAAMLIGRLVGSRLTRRWPSDILLFTSLGLTLIGFPIFWMARIPVINMLGLFVIGLGVANQYPLTLAIAVGMAKEKTNQASARITLAVGTALLLAPLLLGWLADRYGLQTAFGTIILLIVTALGIIIINTRFISKDKPVKNIQSA